MTDDSRDKKPKKQQPGDAGNGKGLDGEAQKQIGRMLKATYDEIAHEPIPDKFRDLLDRLGGSESGKQ